MSPLSLFDARFCWFLVLCICVFWWISGCTRKLLLFGTFCLILFGRWVFSFAAKLGSTGWKATILLSLIMGITDRKGAGVWVTGLLISIRVFVKVRAAYFGCVLLNKTRYFGWKLTVLWLALCCLLFGTSCLLIFGRWLIRICNNPSFLVSAPWMSGPSFLFRDCPPVLLSSGVSPTYLEGPLLDASINFGDYIYRTGVLVWTLAAIIWSRGYDFVKVVGHYNFHVVGNSISGSISVGSSKQAQFLLSIGLSSICCCQVFFKGPYSDLLFWWSGLISCPFCTPATNVWEAQLWVLLDFDMKAQPIWVFDLVCDRLVFLFL